MKFALNLKQTQVPEWKKAYIDYCGLKTYIDDIKYRHARESENAQIDLELPGTFQQDTGSVIDISPEQDFLSSKSRGYMSEPTSTSLTKVPPTFSQDPVPQLSDNARRRSNRLSMMSKVQSLGHRAQKTPVVQLEELLRGPHREFFEKLDFELRRIESFYLYREEQAKAEFSALRQQLSELNNYRRPPGSRPDDQRQQNLPLSHIPSIKFKVRSWLNNLPSRDGGSSTHSGFPGSVTEREKAELASDEYYNRKKKLKTSTINFYRTLEMLDNYRALNTTGFRKALKKFEKVTSIPSQDAYISEKVNPSEFASSKIVKEMIKETEQLFTSTFAHGDRKKALATICTNWTKKSHYFAMFRTGLALGLAVPPLVSGLSHCFSEQTRSEMPEWAVLLFMYSSLFVLVLFALVVGINIVVWNKVRISYVFIFEFEVRTKLDYHAYFEIPAILFVTLCSALWLSFARVNVFSVAPTTWPLVWLVFCALFTMNPLPIYHRSSRWWLYRTLGRLLLPGTRRVKFADFWMADQFCSLIFPLTNLYLFGCVYAVGFDVSWQKCTQGNHLIGPAIISILPLLVRLIQCVKCWSYSPKVIYLINCGKYAFGMMMYTCYYLWVSRGRPRDASMFIYCLFATCYSIYGCTWDFLVDWSVLQVDCKYPMLRGDLLAPEYFPLYYFSIATNALLRFIWISNIPVHGPGVMLRSFLIGLLEMLRRWQWNFYRLETEQLGIADQYWAPGEVPRLQSSDNTFDEEEVIVFSPSYHRRRPDSVTADPAQHA